MIVVIAALGAEWARDRVPSAPSSSARKFLEVGYVEFFERYRIEPRAETKVPEVDFLGPDRQPPPDVESLRRTWLTWD